MHSASVLPSSVLGSWESCRHSAAPLIARVGRPGGGGGATRAVTSMRGKSVGPEPFAPLVKATRQVVGAKDFNKLRGKAISLHSQVIKEFCKSIGADNQQAMQVIRLAKQNGEWLGFLA